MDKQRGGFLIVTAVGLVGLLAGGAAIGLFMQSYAPTTPAPALPAMTSPNGTITMGGSWPDFTIDTTAAAPKRGVTASSAGSALALGCLPTVSASITGVTSSMAVTASPTNAAYPSSMVLNVVVPSTGTVNVTPCSLASIAIPASTFQVVAFP